MLQASDHAIDAPECLQQHSSAADAVAPDCLFMHFCSTKTFLNGPGGNMRQPAIATADFHEISRPQCPVETMPPSEVVTGPPCQADRYANLP